MLGMVLESELGNTVENSQQAKQLELETNCRICKEYGHDKSKLEVDVEISSNALRLLRKIGGLFKNIMSGFVTLCI